MFQMDLDEQLFNIESRRTPSKDLQQLSETLDKKPALIRKDRVRIRSCLRAVFTRHGLRVPPGLADDPLTRSDVLDLEAEDHSERGAKTL